MIRKDVIFAILTTFCLCALMFTVIPIRSGQPYDPWADYNDDSKIDMRDIGNVAARFGTSNTDNLTRNVTVTNWPEDARYKCGRFRFYNSDWPYTFTVSWYSSETAAYFKVGPVSTEGFSKMYLSAVILNASSSSVGGEPTARIYISLIEWTDPENKYINMEVPSEDLSFRIVQTPQNWTNRALDVKGSAVSLDMVAENLQTIGPPGYFTVDIYYYLRND